MTDDGVKVNPYVYSGTVDKEHSTPMSEAQKHSTLGLASSLLAFFSFLLFVFVVGYCLYQATQRGEITSEHTLIAGIVTFAAMLFLAIGLILGLFGLAIKGRKKTFSLIGLCLNSLMLLALVGLLFLGGMG